MSSYLYIVHQSTDCHRLDINTIFQFNACKDIVIFIYETLLLFKNFQYIGICIIKLAITVKGLKGKVEPKMLLSAITFTKQSLLVV